MSYFQRTKRLIIYCEQLQKLSDVQKRPELMNRKVISPRQCETTHKSFGKNCRNMVGMCYHIRIAQTLHHQTSISFAPCKTPW